MKQLLWLIIGANLFGACYFASHGDLLWCVLSVVVVCICDLLICRLTPNCLRNFGK